MKQFKDTFMGIMMENYKKPKYAFIKKIVEQVKENIC